jgi:hypothetical protein
MKIIVSLAIKLIYQVLNNWKGLDEDGHRKAPPLNGTWPHLAP